jgi:hypothetical protein
MALCTALWLRRVVPQGELDPPGSKREEKLIHALLKGPGD